jgi:hypothetical protein
MSECSLSRFKTHVPLFTFQNKQKMETTQAAHIPMH